MEQQAKFEGWAIVEMMGHQKEIGFVTTETYGQAVMFRVDTPELPAREFILARPAYTDTAMRSENGHSSTWSPAGSKVQRAGSPAHSRLVSPGALYAITPCTEEAARTALEHQVERPLILLEAPPRPALAAAGEEEEEGDDDTPLFLNTQQDRRCPACGLSPEDCQCS